MPLLSSTLLGNMHIADHAIDVPLCWSEPERGAIQVFFREVCHVSNQGKELPLLVYLQGGPGGRSPRPGSDGPGWLEEAIKHYRVILPDQRGTGRSSRVNSRVMQRFSSPEQAADYLACFDAHAVVADLEHIRSSHYGGDQWETLGQSYGGFLTLTYLSTAPEGLAGCYITGGLAGLQPDADETYRLTYRRVVSKMAAHLRRYPGDGTILDRLADHIQAHSPTLPNGDPLTVRRLQSIGLMLGMQKGSEQLHWLLEDAFHDTYQTELNPHFLVELMQLTGMDENPLFAALHENIYAHPGGTTRWAAQRQRENFPEFDESARPLFLTGEMIYPWMFDEIQELHAFREGAQQLAQRSPARPYYDLVRLSTNTVPVVAAIYFDDMYVDSSLSLETAEHVSNLTYWLTNEHEHDGLRDDPGVFLRLRKMLQNR